MALVSNYQARVIPALFQGIVDELHTKTNSGLDDFCYYLHRHIGLDGEEHGPMAGKFIVSLCGSDETRWQLWDGVYAMLQRRKASAAVVFMMHFLSGRP